MKFSTVLGASSGKNSILMMPPFSIVISATCFTRPDPFCGSAGLGACAHAPAGTTSATTRAAKSSRVFTYELLLEAGVGGHYAPPVGFGQGQRTAPCEKSVLEWLHGRAQRHSERRHHRPRRPRQDDSRRRHAMAIGH